MKQFDYSKEFIVEARAWDKKHRMLGKEDLEVLFGQSVEAVLSFNQTKACMLDVGAGSGLLGFAWLFLSNKNKCVFIEPIQKKASFILHFISDKAGLRERALVLPKRIEDVSRETIENFCMGDFFVASRAFSSNLSLESALLKSSLGVKHHYVFEKKLLTPGSEEKFVLTKYEL